MVKKQKWDVFISHASEDKKEFVKPLAMLLSRSGIEVWYDEFSLEDGDSLTRSIDKGLANSKFGVLVISKAFIKKKWPEYEMRGLVTREMAGRKKRIIPIRHGVSHKEVVAFSPPLADKLALDTSRQSLEIIALRIIKSVRPDIYTSLQKRAIFKRLLEATERRSVPIDSIDPSPIRHLTLPNPLLQRIHIIYKILREVSPLTLEELIDSFCRDLYPQDNVEQWEIMALAYLNLTENQKLDMEQKEEIFQAVLLTCTGSLTEETFSQFHYVTPQMISDAFGHVIPKIKNEEEKQPE